jgi:hypothetical protein
VKIVSLTAENFKRLKAVQITPTGDMVIVGGQNAQGKSSVLDSIAAALGGAGAAPEQPVRIGAESGAVVIDLGDIIVRRTFGADGKTSLSVKSKEGANFPSPQAMLDKLIGRLSFDPLAFARMKPADQLATLKQLTGLDFTAYDAKRKVIYEARTAVGAVGKSAKARLDALPAIPADTPAEEVSVSDLLSELAQINVVNQRVDDWHRKARALDESRTAMQTSISQMEERLANARAHLDVIMGEINAHGAEPARETIEPIKARIAGAEGINKAVRLAQQKAALVAEVTKATADWQAKSAEIDAIDEAKTKAIAAAPMPVPGLTLTDSGVLLNGVPFAQASSAEQLRVSVAMGLALNPQLRVVLIRDGSLLDAASLALIAEEAAKQDAQVWMEKVSEDGAGCQVVIEDGQVKP